MEMKKIVLLELLKPMRSLSAYSSTSSSSDDEDTENRISHIRVKNYVETIVIQYSCDDFKNHFRMERGTIEVLVELYTTRTTPRLPGGWARVTEQKAVLLTIWYLANMETFRQIADRFNVTLSCAHNIVKNVCGFLVRMSQQYIKWPSVASAEEDATAFRQKKGIQNVLGAIDGTHFRINRPQQHQEDYCNRKGYHSVLMQGVVNSKMEFINIHVGEAGSMHDARVLRRSSLYRKSDDNPDQLFYGKYKILGDSAYPSLPWLMTPVKDNGHLTEEQKNFNYRHSSTRMIIENAFGHLKGRFRRLQKFDNFKIPFVVNCIAAACVLHNICQRRNDHNDELFIEEVEEL